jgi:ABC-type Na+ efflux pump permease subunit
MIRDAFFLARLDLLHLFRLRETWIWAFAMPLVFFYFVGTIVNGRWSDSDSNDPIGVYLPADAGFLAEQFVARLEHMDYQVARVKSTAALQPFRRQILIPAGFTQSVLAKQPVRIMFRRHGAGMGADYDSVRLSRAAYTLVGDLIVVTKDDAPATPEALTKLGQMPRNVKLAVSAAGQRKEIPTGFQQSVPGNMVFFTVMVLLTSGGVTLYSERAHGILRRLASSPMSRGAVVLGKWGSRAALGLIQIGFAMLAGTLFFRVHWGPHYVALGLVLIAYASLAAVLGMLLGNFGRSPQQVAAFGAISANLLAGLGGCWWPIEITPDWAQALAHVIPSGIAMDALHQLLNFGAAPSAVIPHILVLSGAALAGGLVLARTFRFQ